MKGYVCDWCGTLKGRGEAWILGFAAERHLSTGSQLEFSVAEAWSAKNADHYLAVHFCCEEHKNKYIRALFKSSEQRQHSAGAARRREPSESSTSTLGMRTSIGLGTLSGSTSRTASSSPRVSQKASTGERCQSTTKKHPKRAVKRAHFDEHDQIRAHGLSVRFREEGEQTEQPDGDYSSST